MNYPEALDSYTQLLTAQRDDALEAYRERQDTSFTYGGLAFGFGVSALLAAVGVSALAVLIAGVVLLLIAGYYRGKAKDAMNEANQIAHILNDDEETAEGDAE